MAKYTQLLAEYLEDGGQLPGVFNTINGFTDLFKGEYYDREIGFETPALFALKLEHKANLVCPIYLQRIRALQSIQSGNRLLNASKSHIKSGDIQRTKNGEIIHTEGATDETTTSTPEPTTQNTKTYDQPFATTGNAPALTQPMTVTDVTTTPGETTTHSTSVENTSSDSFNNYVEQETYNNVTDDETGNTIAEGIQLTEFYTQNKDNIMRDLLAEFEDLFMGIF